FGARAESGGIGAGTGLGQAVAGEMLHRAELWQEALALIEIAEAVDHPGGHVVDRDVRRRARTSGSQLLHDQRRVEAPQRTAADIVVDVDAAEAQRRRLAQGVCREDLLGVPLGGMRQHLVGRELPRRVAKGLLVLGECKVHAGAIIAGCYARAMQWRDMTPEEVAKRPEARLRGMLLYMVIVAVLLCALMFIGLVVAPDQFRAVGGRFQIALAFVNVWAAVFVVMTVLRLRPTPLLASIGIAAWVIYRIVVSI